MSASKTMTAQTESSALQDFAKKYQPRFGINALVMMIAPVIASAFGDIASVKLLD